MARFWKDKRGEPLYSFTYYNVEFFGITHSFPENENLRNFRDKIAARKLDSPLSWLRRRGGSFTVKNLFRRNGFCVFKFRLRESYILFRHQEEIIDIFDRAFEHFRAEKVVEPDESRNDRSRR